MGTVSFTVPVASFHLVRFPAWFVPVELVRYVTQRRHLDRLTGLRFSKVLGTARGQSMSLSADLRRWALFCVWDDHDQARELLDDSPIGHHWRRHASEAFHVQLEPVSGHGRWSGVEPLGTLPRLAAPAGPIAVLTRATLRWRRVAEFHRAVPPVDTVLAEQHGLLASVGMGEAPVGRQGTFSLWESARAIDSFAYRHRAHRDVIHTTRERDWYREELFVRFSPMEHRGTWNGADPLATFNSPVG